MFSSLRTGQGFILETADHSKQITCLHVSLCVGFDHADVSGQSGISKACVFSRLEDTTNQEDLPKDPTQIVSVLEERVQQLPACGTSDSLVTQ
jgi:hypothetical protein